MYQYIIEDLYKFLYEFLPLKDNSFCLMIKKQKNMRNKLNVKTKQYICENNPENKK